MIFCNHNSHIFNVFFFNLDNILIILNKVTTFNVLIQEKEEKGPLLKLWALNGSTWTHSAVSGSRFAASKIYERLRSFRFHNFRSKSLMFTKFHGYKDLRISNNFHVEDFPKFPTWVDDERLRRRLGIEFK